MRTCKNCMFYSDNMLNENLRDNYCCLNDIGDFCKRDKNDYCSHFKFAGCKTCKHNVPLTELDISDMLRGGIINVRLTNNQEINKCDLDLVCIINGVCTKYQTKNRR